MAQNQQELLLILMPWTPDQALIDSFKALAPGLEVESRLTELYQSELPADIPAECWRRVTALLTWRLLPPTREAAPALRYVQLLSAGCNHFYGNPLFEDPDVTFCTANGVHPAPITEWVFSCFLAYQHHLPQHLENQKKHEWVTPVTDEDTEDAVGLRVGILGYDAIGRQTARAAKAFGMDVHAYTLHERATPSSRRDDSFTEPGLGDPDGVLPSRWFHGPDQLAGFLGSGLDLLVVLLPLTHRTRGLISTEQLRLLARKRAYLCNAGRGAIVDTVALMAALDAGWLRGAALDVTDPEPLPADHPLWDYRDVIITPHVSGNTNSYYRRACKILAANLERRAKGEKLINAVDRELGY